MMKAHDFSHAGRADLRRGRAVRCVLAASLLGCSSTQLVPESPVDGGLARAESAGIVVQADADAHDGPAYLPADIEPVKLRIHNGSGRGIHVSLDAIELAANGRESAAIPPQSIEPLPPITPMGFVPTYPMTHSGPAGVDLRLSSLYHDPRRELAFGPGALAARQAELVSKAFVGGFIDSGETREGFAYFAEPRGDVERLEVVVPVHTGQGSGALTTIMLPFVVES
jgi:hypothetical protein